MLIGPFFKTAFVAINSLTGQTHHLQTLDTQIKSTLQADTLIGKYDPNIETEYRIKTQESAFYKVINRHRIPLDRLGIRIIYETSHTNDEFLAYYILKNIESHFDQTELMDDYILHPKENGYQSLHINLIYEDRLFEIQVRNRAMDNCAKYGSASNYKEDTFYLDLK